MSSQTRNGHIFWYVEKGDTLWGITQKVYKNLSPAGIQKKIAEVQKINPHIKNPNLIHPKSIIHFGPVNGFSAQPTYANDFSEMERTLESCSVHEKDFLFKNYETVDTIRAVAAQKKIPLPIPSELSQAIDKMKWGNRIAKAASKTIDAVDKDYLRLAKTNVFQWRQIEGELVENVAKEIRYAKQANNVIGLIPKGAETFEVGAGKLLVVNAEKAEGMLKFAVTLKQNKDLVGKLVKGSGKIFKGADAVLGAANIYDKWGTAEQNVTIFKETGKFGMGLYTGTLSFGAANAVCGFLTFTTGVGGVACYLTVFVGTSYLSSKAGESLGEGTYWLGKQAVDFIYQSDAPVNLPK